jgi:uncharacterized protein with NAD-binding domain and iron-sulfur cluster
MAPFTPVLIHPSTPPRRQRIAILGGGMASLTAAYELTNHEDWRERYEVTVYQLGWRLGGKTATGRGPCDRIEEVGIHILQGWYDNAFRLLREVYRERREKGLAPESPYPSWEQALEKEHSTLLTEYSSEEGRWTSWPLVFPWNDQVPGEGGALSYWEVFRKGVALAVELMLGTPFQKGRGPLAAWLMELFFPPETARARPDGEAPRMERLARKMEEDWRRRLGKVERSVLRMARRVTELLPGLSEEGRSPVGPARQVLGLLGELVGRFMERARPWLARDEVIRRVWILLELTYVHLKGVLADVYDVEARRFRFERINALDYRQWLARHGASALALDSAVVRFVYTGTFANGPGTGSERGLIAAGTALRFVARSVGYKGAFVWKLKAGTGDTLVAPLYQVLKSRGVRFEFFRDVQQVHASDTGEVETITLGDQVDLSVDTYEPLVRAGDVRAWPAQPRWEQLVPEQAQALRQRGVDLESPWSGWPCVRVRQLRKGVDFDQVILGIPVGALPRICSEIIARDARWQRMVENVRTVATQSVQLWLEPSLRELGMDPEEWGMPEGGEPNLVTYANPLYSWIEMSLVMRHEAWPEHARPRALLYLSGTLREDEPLAPEADTGFPHRQYERVRESTEQWLRSHMGYFFPRGTTPEHPQGLELNLLAAPHAPQARGAAKLRHQYLRANLAPSMRYTLSLPGSAQHRLRTQESGYRNLFLTGDWIDYGMNVGYIEGAVTSGAQAAQALRRALGCQQTPSLFVDLDPGL